MWATPYGVVVGSKGSGKRKVAVAREDMTHYYCFNCDVALVETQEYRYVCPSCLTPYAYAWSYLGERPNAEWRDEAVTTLRAMTEAERLEHTKGQRPKCPACGSGEMASKYGKFGYFLACVRYPACRHTAPHPTHGRQPPAS